MTTVPELKARNVVTLTATLLAHNPKLAPALELMAFAHDGQMRHQQRPEATYHDPYAIHPIRVALRLIRLVPGASTELLTAALLHDVIEDAPEHVAEFYDDYPDESIYVSFQAERLIEEEFGPAVSRAVAALTKNSPGHDNLAYEVYFNRLLSNNLASLVKASDLIDNAGALREISDTTKATRLADKYRHPVEVMIGHFQTNPNLDELTARLRQVRDTL